MDTVTHTLFGVILYRAIPKTGMNKPMTRALLLTSLVGSQIPDIDVVSQWWDTSGQYLMWHRGITHSIFLAPVWALLISLVCLLLFKTKDWRLFWIGLLAVFIHDTSDIFNAWGTGYLEPFTQQRLTFGTIPIVDLVFWVLILGGFVVTRWKRHLPTHRVFQGVWALIALHIAVQSIQGYAIYDSAKERYEQVALAADFVPWSYQVIGKAGDTVEISQATTAFGELKLLHRLPTATQADLTDLFAQNPAARTLQQWAPLVVIVDEPGRTGLYDPRFYRNGQSFLFEYIDKK